MSYAAKTFMTSSFVSAPIFAVIICRNSGNSIEPEPSASTSVIIFLSSCLSIFIFSALSAAFSSL